MFVDLARLPVLPQQPAKNPLSPHPLYLAGHPGLSSTLPLTGTGVTALALRRKEIAGTSARVDGGGLDDDSPVLNELLYMCTGVGIPDLSLLAGVKPDFALAAAGDRGGEALLGSEVHHSYSKDDGELDERSRSIRQRQD